MSGGIGMIKPDLSFWFILIPLLPGAFRLIAGTYSINLKFLNLLMGLFLTTAVVGYFVSYDQAAAHEKLYYIVISILLFYSLSRQPEENADIISSILFVIGISISSYFFLTYDFSLMTKRTDLIGKITFWWMGFRPQLMWKPIPSGYVPGLTLITVPFIARQMINPINPPNRYSKLFIGFGLFLVLIMILATSSLSVWVALFSASAVWIIWKIYNHRAVESLKQNYFWLVLIFLSIVVTFIYTLGPATSSHPNYFGDNSRREVLGRSIYFLLDFPFTGGGLASFPGLYSEYILRIPYIYFPNSYNLFLDVAIEQGVAGGISFLAIGLVIFFQLVQKIQKADSRIHLWVPFLVLIFASVHGLMQDYLYNGMGTILLFLPGGMAVMLARLSFQDQPILLSDKKKTIVNKKYLAPFLLLTILLVGIIAYRNRLTSKWYANLGAVRLAQVELAKFPNSGWVGLDIVPKLDNAEMLLKTALMFNPDNLTANYRLGLIYMLRRDYVTAANYLEVAKNQVPDHRGIIKSLGYDILWMGKVDNAYALLSNLPEVLGGELDAYYWWWQTQDRSDLSGYAASAIDIFRLSTKQP
jgi:tetratricopeptide (TPR) repeat protein